ncbi:hypothetical protein NHE_0135 [Neorickettsia helminthoeca str. Oregon]|uniref:Uncharacterized protein n=1 Tax=Neorickettsia helminthoeca str. Oregon TaxID=1286528 RepID=X5HJ65_9RICK|nr:hypothetical protein NHE_0135 [Neorickettsia helminthoeca str. Oregon]
MLLRSSIFVLQRNMSKCYHVYQASEVLVALITTPVLGDVVSWLIQHKKI